MKLFFTLLALQVTISAFGQLQAPQLSPKAEFEQIVGLTEIEVSYSRPSLRGRRAFGEIVPFGETWRTGANENTLIECSESLVFGADTLRAGEYAIYTRPNIDSWDVIFYNETGNWGTPDVWDEKKEALVIKVPVKKLNDVQESFRISIENIALNNATLDFAWENTLVSVPFEVGTREQMKEQIKKVMSGPTVTDYYRAADYLLNEQQDLQNALVYMDKALELKGERPFWMLRKRSLIQAGLKDFKGAITTAEESLKLAKEAGNEEYVKMNEDSIREWKKK